MILIKIIWIIVNLLKIVEYLRLEKRREIQIIMLFLMMKEKVGQELSLAIMDVAGAPAQVAVNAKPGDTVVVMGAGKAGAKSIDEYIRSK